MLNNSKLFNPDIENQYDTLDTNSSATDIEKFLINQVNILVNDIKELETFKTHIYNIFPKETNWKSIHVIESRLKTMSSLFSTILNYKQELNKLLFKLQTLLDPGLSDDTIKDLIKMVQDSISKTNADTKKYKNKIKSILEDTPNFMPKN